MEAFLIDKPFMSEVLYDYTSMQEDDLGAWEVFIDVKYSSLNYKDSLVMAGAARVSGYSKFIVRSDP